MNTIPKNAIQIMLFEKKVFLLNAILVNPEFNSFGGNRGMFYLNRGYD